MHLYCQLYQKSVFTTSADIVVEYIRPDGKKRYFVCAPAVLEEDNLIEKYDQTSQTIYNPI